jgi:hypothetical protein
VAASMARASTDGLGDAACAAPRPPLRPVPSSFPWRRYHVRLTPLRGGLAVVAFFFLSCGVVAEVSSHGDGRIIPPQLFLPDNGIERE